ncbi:sugar phosphate isomerase/epimerase family protein [Nocardia sp. NPDC059177]|uniref:sugar phosphate isomerase/epimerase family protein n=1 Tax=Nocardia sp. NPDC059177 TaxID=3346759 RepID=UPI0036C4B528
MIRSIATVTLGGTLPEKLDAIAAAGFRYVELVSSDLDGFDGTARDVKELADSYGLRILAYQPFRDFEGRPRHEFGHHVDRARTAIETTRTLGADLLLVCSAVVPDAVGDDDIRTADLRVLAGLGADAEVRIGYEALSWGKFASRSRDAWALVERVDHPNFGLVLDTFHSLAIDEELSFLDAVPVERIFLIQVADAPYLEAEIIQWSRHHRCLPGEGSFDLEAFLSIPIRNGYSGPLSLEVFSDQLTAGAPAPVAINAYRSLCKLEYDCRNLLRSGLAW